MTDNATNANPGLPSPTPWTERADHGRRRQACPDTQVSSMSRDRTRQRDRGAGGLSLRPQGRRPSAAAGARCGRPQAAVLATAPTSPARAWRRSARHADTAMQPGRTAPPPPSVKGHRFAARSARPCRASLDAGRRLRSSAGRSDARTPPRGRPPPLSSTPSQLTDRIRRCFREPSAQPASACTSPATTRSRHAHNPRR
jgi:hypothetical protein